MKYFIHLPMKMEPTVSSETLSIRTQTPGNYPKMNKLQFVFSCSNIGFGISGVGFQVVEIFIDSFMDDVNYVRDVELCM